MYKFQKFQFCNKQSSIIFPKWTSIFLYIFLTLDIRYATAEVKYACKMFLAVPNVPTGTPVFNETERRIFVESITELFTTTYLANRAPGFIKIDEVWHEDGKDWVTYYTLHFTSGPINPPWVLRGRKVWVSTHLTGLLKRKGSVFHAISNFIERYIEGGTPRFIPITTTYRGQIITTRPFYTPSEDRTSGNAKTASTPCPRAPAQAGQVVGFEVEGIKSGAGNPGVVLGVIISFGFILFVGFYIFSQRKKKIFFPVDRELTVSYDAKSDEFNLVDYDNQFDQ